MDAIDISLIELLQQNSRCTVSELSKKLNLSRPSVSERILRLQEQGVIEEFSARISLKSVGRRILFFVEIGCMSASTRTFERMISQEDCVLECHSVSGKNDYILKAAVNDIDDMTVFINKLIPYGNVSTSVVLESPVPYRYVAPIGKEAD